MSSFHIYLQNQFKIIPLGCMLRPRKVILPKLWATSDVRYYVNQVRRCVVLLTDMEEKQAWIGKCKYVTRQITLTPLSRRHVTLSIVECRK